MSTPTPALTPADYARPNRVDWVVDRIARFGLNVGEAQADYNRHFPLPPLPMPPPSVPLAIIAAAIQLPTFTGSMTSSPFNDGVRFARGEVANLIASTLTDPAARTAFLTACGL